MNVDLAIIGAGVVGLAVAERLSRRASREVLLIEQHDKPGTETTSRNSQVIHAGMYYPSGTHKARLCVRGNVSLLEYCQARQVPFARVGKLIVATSADEEPELARLLTQGQANGVRSLVPVDAAFVTAHEPRVHATAALWSPDTGIVDAHALVGALETEARDHGVTFAYKHRLVAVDRASAGYSLRLDGPDHEPITVTARSVVNAAGLHADTVAALAGLDVDAAGYRLHWVKGRYFRVRAHGQLRHLVYPVPAKHLAGLGVHVTVGLDGDVRLGPDVQLLPDRTADFDVAEALRDDFLRGASRYLPWLTPELLSPDTAGIRPKRSRPGEPFRDFVIAEESARGLPGWVNLVGIESPGLTCALELAREVDALC